MSYEELKLSNQLCHPLYSASNALIRAYAPLLNQLDITFPQYLIMMALWEKDSVPIKHLIEVTYFDSGTLTPILQRLKEKSLILIKKDREDQRVKIIELSKKGLRLRDEAREIPAKMFCLVDFDDAEINLLKKLTQRLRNNLVTETSDT